MEMLLGFYQFEVNSFVVGNNVKVVTVVLNFVFHSSGGLPQKEPWDC